MQLMDKRDRADLFRQRLAKAIEKAGMNRSSLARATDVDRSTIGQLLDAKNVRLPNAQLAAAAAETLGVSSDWLLGLTDRPERPGDIVSMSVQTSEAERSAADEQILEWHREAKGYKIRHVPATLPDMLKTEDVLQWEYAEFIGRSTTQAITAMRDRIAFISDLSADYEIAIPLHEMQAFAQGSGYYAGLNARVRRDQLEVLAGYCRDLYPGLRVYLFDARKVFSAPITVFGPLHAVIYVGRFYLAFRETGRVRMLTEQFDWLVRAACVDAREAESFFRNMKVD